MPLSTLRLKPRGVNRKTQGQDGVRFLLSCKALSSSTTCRFIPAHPQIGFEPMHDWFTTFSIGAEFSDPGFHFSTLHPAAFKVGSWHGLGKTRASPTAGAAG